MHFLPILFVFNIEITSLSTPSICNCVSQVSYVTVSHGTNLVQDKYLLTLPPYNFQKRLNKIVLLISQGGHSNCKVQSLNTERLEKLSHLKVFVLSLLITPTNPFLSPSTTSRKPSKGNPDHLTLPAQNSKLFLSYFLSLESSDLAEIFTYTLQSINKK